MTAAGQSPVIAGGSNGDLSYTYDVAGNRKKRAARS